MSTRLADLELIIDRCMRDSQAPGFAVGIVFGGDTLYAQGFGYHENEQQQKMTARSPFAIQSCTKAFTATIAGLLVDRGMFTWDCPIREYVPTFRMFDPTASAQATMRDLLSHRTGMPFGGHDWLRVATPPPRQEYLERLPYLEPNQPFRHVFQYSNLMYIVAGALMEQVTGISWEAMVQQWIFTPLGMDDSGFGEKRSQVDDAGPCGAITSTIEDMCRWVQVHLGATAVPSLSSRTVREMHTSQIFCPNPVRVHEVMDDGCAMGWFTQQYRGHRLLAHWGGATGPTIVSCMPDDGIGIIVHSTREASPFHAINAVAFSIYDRLLRLEPIS